MKLLQTMKLMQCSQWSGKRDHASLQRTKESTETKRSLLVLDLSSVKWHFSSCSPPLCVRVVCDFSFFLLARSVKELLCTLSTQTHCTTLLLHYWCQRYPCLLLSNYSISHSQTHLSVHLKHHSFSLSSHPVSPGLLSSWCPWTVSGLSTWKITAATFLSSTSYVSHQHRWLNSSSWFTKYPQWLNVTVLQVTMEQQRRIWGLFIPQRPFPTTTALWL